MKKLIIMGMFMMSVSFGFATEITFSPATGDLPKGCLITADVMIDTDNQEISATDLIIESSLDFVDFVPSDMFPYFLPPKTKSNITHIIGFTVDPQNRTKGSGSIGTLYFKQQNEQDRDGTIKLYFKNKGNTIDSNLSIAGGIDILDRVGSAYYTFINNTGSCVHYVGESIPGGIANKSLDTMMKKVSRDQQVKTIFTLKTLIGFVGLILILTILFIYYKHSKQGKVK